MKRRGSKTKRPTRNWIPQAQQSKPRIFHPIGDPSCYKCAMPGIHRCQFPGCTLPMCSKHRIRKAGGSLCDAHQGAKLIQEASVPSRRFKNTQVSYVPTLTRDPDNA